MWFADRGFWALVIEFQPSGFSKGSYLNICARWFWHPSDGWPFNYFQRAGTFIEFENVEQFKLEAEWLAGLAATEAALLDNKFASLEDIAVYLKQQVQDAKGPWMLYHAAIAAGLTGDREFGLECFDELLAQEADVDWMREMQTEAATLAKHLGEGGDFFAAIRKKVTDTRTALKLPPLGEFS